MSKRANKKNSASNPSKVPAAACPPAELPNLCVGYLSTREETLGFQPIPRTKEVVSGEPVEVPIGLHYLTVAPTGAGKGRSAIIPTLLDYPGPAIVLDPKGENAQVTARARREMGQEVYILDPFRSLGPTSHALNPLDVLDLNGADVETEAQTLAAMFSQGNRFAKDPFWDNNARGLIAGLIAYFSGTPGVDRAHRNLPYLCDFLQGEDPAYNIAVLLDRDGAKMPRLARRELAAFLNQPEKETRPSVLSTAVSYLKDYNSERVSNTLKTSDVALVDVVRGKPLTIYIVIPPDRLDSHVNLMRLWVGCLLKTVFTRRRKPALPTLFLLDECGQLGNLAALQSAVTLARGYGLSVWSFWQDLCQLKQSFPQSWETILNNCSMLQTFGTNNYFMANQWGELLNTRAATLLSLAPNEQLLRISGRGEIRCQRPDYLRDKRYEGKFDGNWFFDPPSDEDGPEVGP